MFKLRKRFIPKSPLKANMRVQKLPKGVKVQNNQILPKIMRNNQIVKRLLKRISKKKKLRLQVKVGAKRAQLTKIVVIWRYH